MKIALNCAFYQPKGGGIKEYIDNLVNQLAILKPSDIDFIIYVLHDQFEYAKSHLPGNLKIKKIPYKSGSLFNRIKRSLLEGKFWKEEEKKEKFDIFHSPFFHAPNLKKAKVMLTVHDLRLYRFPQTYEFFRYRFLKRKVKNSIRRANHIISISEFTKKEIQELCGVKPDKITVIQEAINQDRFTDKHLKTPDDLSETIKSNPFLLTVGHMEPRKNYDRLIDAFLQAKQNPELKDLQLVIVGKKDHSYADTLQKIETTPDVHYLNFVEGNTLLWLYKNTSLFVFPSYYEGFGFPPLEAAALGSISAVSNVSSMPEVCGDAVIYFNPYKVDDIAQAIQKGLLNKGLIAQLESKLQKNLDRFSWKKNALETINVYQGLI